MIRAAGRVPVALALIGLAATQVPAAGDMPSVADSCLACHSNSADKPGGIASLQGLNEVDIVAAMREFRSGAREATIMGRLAKGFTDTEISAVAKAVSATSWHGRRP